MVCAAAGGSPWCPTGWSVWAAHGVGRGKSAVYAPGACSGRTKRTEKSPRRARRSDREREGAAADPIGILRSGLSERPRVGQRTSRGRSVALGRRGGARDTPATPSAAQGLEWRCSAARVCPSPPPRGAGEPPARPRRPPRRGAVHAHFSGLRESPSPCSPCDRAIVGRGRIGYQDLTRIFMVPPPAPAAPTKRPRHATNEGPFPRVPAQRRSASTRCAWTMSSVGDHLKIVKRPSCDATSAIESR